MDVAALIQLSECALPDPSGRTIPLGRHWRERPVVLVFLRHFG
ncbi:MAG: hypothetical protein ACT4OX_08200 [Actinomycetota bacterium]